MPPPAPAPPPLAVPTAIGRRRLAYAAALAATWAAMTLALAYTLGEDGLGPLDLIMLLSFAVALPWSVIGFWNSAIGLWLLLRGSKAIADAAPAIPASGRDTAPMGQTALLVFIRHESLDRLRRNLTVMLRDLAATGHGDRFRLFILSDSSDATTGAAEAALAAALDGAMPGAPRVTYRRRETNNGYKTGNLWDFLHRWGSGYDFFLSLDADSVMSGQAILRLVRAIEADPRTGIVQALVVGMPSTSAFARLFQFGMRLGMRSFTIGSAWWQADCGPYWGHNAVIRRQPFMEHCVLPDLPGPPPLGGPILSHDQVEAVLMRRGGYAVRILPVEDGNWEENPPNLIEFMRRDFRWCNGNLQYLRLFGWPGLLPVSRFQLGLAIAMFIGAPAWLLFFAAACLQAAGAEDLAAYARPTAAGWLLAVFLVMSFQPKIATLLAVLFDAGERRRFGGMGAFLGNVALETLFTLLIVPVMTAQQGWWVCRLLAGRGGAGWGVQNRDESGLAFADAARALRLPTALGLVLVLWLWLAAPHGLALLWPIYASLVLAAPFAWLTAQPAMGHWCIRLGIGELPEERAVPPILAELDIPALRARPS